MARLLLFRGPILLVLLLSSAVPADPYDDALLKMRRELPDHFLVERSGIFILASDLSRARLEDVRDRTLGPCARSLSAMFFATPPARPIRVYLFHDADSYRRWARTLFGTPPSTPYGFFKSSHNALVMDISTGGGTLVHELTHALTEPDFPACPAWLFEGLGSLFEQCEFRGAELRGQVNWRLPLLQRSLQNGTALPLRKLLALSDDDFYGEGSGLHYAEARYLLMYLQEKELLTSFYRRFRKGQDADPDGIKTMEAVTGMPLETLEKNWRAWARKLEA